jgi:cell division protein ZipA
VSLRVALLIVGVLLIIGVYLWSAFRRRRDNRLTYRPHFARIEPSRRSKRSVKSPDTGESPFEDAVIDLDQFPRAQDDEFVDLPRITLDRRDEQPANTSGGQLEMCFDASAGDPEAGQGDPAATRGGAPAAPELLAIYIRAPAGRSFSGPDIVKVLNTVGMRFGDLGIFHHFGAGELHSERAVFSAANMLEPGHFDLDKIDSVDTKGLAMFIQLPAPLDGAVAFELFLNTAQRTAEALSGELYADPQAKLTNVCIDKMRRTAALYSDDGL